MNSIGRLKSLMALCLLAALAGCVAPNAVYHSDSALSPPLHPKLTLLRPDVVVSLHTAGGVKEPRADWSENVANQLRSAVSAHLFDAGVDFIDAPAASGDEEYAMRQSINLVLDSVELALTKGAIGDPRAYVISRDHADRIAGATGADYALALAFRANRSSGGRRAVGMLTALAGVSIDMDSTQFRVALIDLRDGHVKWANFDTGAILDSDNPDSTSERRWRRAVGLLMSEFPL